MSIDPDKLSEALPQYLKQARGVVPPDCDISLANTEDAPTPTYDPAAAREIFLDCQAKTNNDFPKNISILCPDSKAINAALKPVVSDWQKNLGAYINIETVKDQTEFENRIASGNYDIALIPFTSGDLSAAAFLSQFKSESNSDPTRFKSSAFDTALQTACSVGATDEQMHAAEQILFSSDDRLIPLFFAPVSYAYSEKLDKNSINFKSGFLDISVLRQP